MTITPSPVVWLTGWGFRPSVLSELIQQTHQQLTLMGGNAEANIPDLLVDHPPATSLNDWAEQLAAQLPSGSTVIGWSLGGMLALALAARHPAKVSSLGLIATSARFVCPDDSAPAGLASDTVLGFNQGFASQPAATVKRFLALQCLGDQQRRLAGQQLAAHLVTELDSHHAALAQGLQLLADSDLCAMLPSIHQPVRVLHGAGDALMPVAGSHWLTEQLPNAGLTVFADSGHALPVTQTARCASLLASFLLDGMDFRQAML